MSTTEQLTQGARPTGEEIRERVVGKPPGQGDPFLAPFFETAIVSGAGCGIGLVSS